MGRLKPTPRTQNRLFALSGNRCAFPLCNCLLASSEQDQVIANICHIEAAEIGGERYNPNQTDEQRRDFNNLILLCANHHITTNDVEVYTVDVLRKMKQEHQNKQQMEQKVIERFQQYPSILGKIISEVSKQEKRGGASLVISHVKEFTILSKIKHNNVIRYKSIIDRYKIYQGKLDKIYQEFERNGSNDKDRLFEQIKNLYELAKGKFGISDNNILEIQKRADDLIDEVKEGLDKIIEKSNNVSNLPIEIIDIGILIIIVDSFMRCKILEEPPEKK